MSLGELVSGLGLWVYPVVGLLAFLSVFVAVGVRAWRASDVEMQRCAALPVHAGEHLPPATGAGPRARGTTCCGRCTRGKTPDPDHGPCRAGHDHHHPSTTAATPAAPSDDRSTR